MDLERIAQLKEENLRAMELYARLLSLDGAPFTPEEIASFARDSYLSEQEAFLFLLSAVLGLEPDTRAEDKSLIRHYLSPALKKMEPASYLQNPCRLLLPFPEAREGAWRFTHLSYAPFQAFPRGNLLLLPSGRIQQPLGYFPEAFSYPAVLEKEREWMTLTPNEIETMQLSVAAAHGRAAVFGLGLGYFAFMAARKKEVSSLTVIERDENAIRLFQKWLLPHFPGKEKITLRHADAFDFIQAQAGRDSFDFAFVDLWHDVSDGLPLYLRFRKMESAFPLASFHYWIEQDMLIFLRELLLEDALSMGPLSRFASPFLSQSPFPLPLESVRDICLSLSPEDISLN